MKRRGLLAGAAISLASGAWAQVSAMPRIAYLSGRSRVTDDHLLQAFRQGLKTAGYVDGQNVTMDVRWADGRYDQLTRMAADLVATRPALIVAVGGNPVGLAVKAATSTIPIVFGAGADPVAIGLVSSLSRPDGNLTGMTLSANELDAKRLELLHDILPGARTVALLYNPANPGSDEALQGARQVSRTLGLKLDVFNAASSADIEKAFVAVPRGSVDALAVGADAFLINRRGRIIELAAERHLPAIFPARECAADGGLVSYGTRWADMYRVIGTYAGRILKGAKPAELPIVRPTTFELVVNLATARTLGLTMSPMFLASVDEVIE